MAEETHEVPDVDETDLTREELEAGAEELGVEHGGLDDQELLERIGVALGEIDEDETSAKSDDEPSGAAGEDEADDVDDDEPSGSADEDESSGDEDAGDTEEDADTDEDPGDTDEDDHAVREPGEYRVERDPREHVVPVLDLELGPVALDVLGLEIHLKRVHAALTSNPDPDHAILGKLLSRLGRLLAGLDSGSPAGRLTDQLDRVREALPSPFSDDDDDDDEGSGGLLETLAAPAKAAGRGVKQLVSRAGDLGSSADETAREATQAASDADGVARSVKAGTEAVTDATSPD